MRPRSRLPLVLVWALLGAAAVSVPGGSAQSQDASPAGGDLAPLRYRRVYVPQDRIKDWPYGGVRYVPMDKAEFERLKDAAGVPLGSPAASTAQVIASARYSARLAGDALVDGEAMLDLQGVTSGPVLVPLDPCGLAIGEAVWATEDLRPAKLASGSDGRLLVVAEGAGRLQWKWSLAGRRDPLGSIEFSLELPACPANRLSLELPKGVVPWVEHGVVLQEAAANDPAVRWRIELGGCHRQRLRLTPSEEPDPKRKPNAVRQAMTYDVGPGGINVSALLALDVPGAPLRQVVLEMDPGLRLTSARYGDSAIPWSVVPGSKEGGKSRVVLELPGPARGFSRLLRLTAAAPLRLGRRWRLPSLRAEDLFWEEGSATLSVPAPFALEGLSVIEGRQTGAGRLTVPRVGDSIELQYFTRGGGVEVVLAMPRAPLQLATGATLDLNDAEMTARMVADLRVTQGERFDVDADVPGLWAIDTVETIPADALSSWDFRPKGGGQGKLAVRLAKPVAPARPVRLLVTARHFHSPLGQVFSAKQLTPLGFPGARGGRRLVMVRAADAFQVRVAGDDGLSRIDPQSLTAAERELLAEPPTGLLFEDDATASRLQVSLEPKKPRYWAAIRVEAAASGQNLVESYRIACVPEGGRVDRLLIQFAVPEGTPLPWVLSGEGEGRLSVRPWQPAGPSGLPAPAQGRTWEVTLRRPRNLPFEVRATRVSPLGKAMPVNLVCLPEAGSQRGTLVVDSSGPTAIRLQGNRLTPIPAEPVAGDPSSAARTTYRYDPLREVAAAGAGAAILTPGDNRLGPPTAWAWSCHLESRYEPDGVGRHLATFRVQNAGRGQLEIELPRPLTGQHVQGIWIDESRAAWHSISGDPTERVAVALPPGRRFALVSVQFLTDGPRLGTFARLEPVLPTIDIPVLARTWSVWLPSGYRAVDSSLPALGGDEPAMTFSQRLFGPLGQGAGAKPFRPWVGEDWGRLVLGHPESAALAFRPQPLLEQLGAAERARRRAGPADAVSGPEPSGPRAPWPVVELAGHGPGEALGWTTYQVDLGAGQGVRLAVVHTETVRALGWAAFLATLALGAWRGLLRPEWLACAAGLAAASALVLPEVYVPIASGPLLGLVCVFLLRFLYRTRPKDPAAPDAAVSTVPPAPPSTTSAVVGIFLLAGTAIWLQGLMACAEEPAAKPRAEPIAVHNVLIPVDAQEKPAGDKYYVPEGLFGQLQRLAAARSNPPQGWLIHDAAYRGTMIWQSSPERLTLEDLKATLDLEVSAPRVRVRIPIGGQRAPVATAGVLLEGRPIPVEWSEKDGQMSLEVMDPGRYRLDVPLRPTPPSGGRSSVFEMRIPRLATSRVELAVPRDAPSIEVPSSLGAVVREANPPEVTAQLGPADRLTIRWQERRAGSPAAAPLEVEQLLWLRVQPGSVVLDALVKLKAAEGEVRQLQVAVDPRLRLLPLDKDRGATRRVEILPGHPQVLRFDVAPPASGPWVERLSFLLTGHPGVGSLRLPYLDVCDARTTRRWMAVSVDPRLEHQLQPGVGLQPLSAMLFLTAWGEAKAQPLVAYHLASARPDWSISTRPVPTRTTAEQTLWLRCDEEGIHVLLEAVLETAGGPKFQCPVAAPPGLQVQEVWLGEHESQRAARWSRARDGTVVVFLDGPTYGRQSLRLRGWLPAARDGVFPLGGVSVKADDLKSSTLHVYRHPAVRVEVNAVPGLIEVAGPIGDEGKPTGRWAKSLETQGGVPAGAILKLAANRPKIEGEQITALHREAGAWQGKVRFRLRVGEGLADQFRVEVPGSWAGPFVVDPPASVAVSDLADRPGRVLVIRPRAAMEGASDLTVASPLSFSPGERVGVGEIMLGQAEITERVLVLPIRTDLGPLAWETQGLAPVPLAEQYASSPGDRDWLVAYKVVQRPFQAVLKPPDRPRVAPQVLLADIGIVWQADGTWHGVAAFDVEPAGLSVCTFRLPEGCRLIQATAGEAPAACAAGDNRTWQVSLGPGALPQRIEILFAGTEPDPVIPRPPQLGAPEIVDMPARQTLWSICGPGRFDVATGEGLTPADRLDQEMVRLRTIAEMIEKAVSSAAGEPEELVRWYRPWARRWNLSQERVLRRLASAEGTEASASARAEVEALQRRQSLFAERLGAGEGLAQGPGETAPSEDPIGLWRWNLDRSQSAVRCITEPGAQGIPLVVREPRRDWPWWRVLVAAGIAAGTAVLVVGIRRGVLPRAASRSPHLVGAAGGLIWWLMLTPSALGLLLMGGSLVGWWAARRRNHKG